MAYESDLGAFLPTTTIFDRPLIESLDVNSQEFKDFLIQLYQTTNNAAQAINEKDTGFYVDTEFVNGQMWFPNPNLSSTTSQSPQLRQVFRKVINFGALPNATSKTAAHGIGPTSVFTFTRIYGTASDTTGLTYLPIPYAHATAANIIRIDVDATNVTITTGIDRTAYDTCYVVLEYIKQ